jgi:XTP/dITP diphosphohydrolase
MPAQKIKQLYFVTSNENKLREARRILGVPIKQLKMEIIEPQLWDIREVSKEKAKQAYDRVHKPLFVEDTAIYIHSLAGFPGPFISWVRQTIGNRGLLKLMEGVKDRRAETKAVITFYDGKMLKQFVGSVEGELAEAERGGGWGFDPIFVHNGYGKTYGELGEEKKNEISHRALAFKKFKKWLQN